MYESGTVLVRWLAQEAAAELGFAGTEVTGVDVPSPASDADVMTQFATAAPVFARVCISMPDNIRDVRAA